MAVRVINPARTIEFILEDDRASENPTVFVLRPMTWEQLGEFNSASPLSSENAAEIADVLRLAREEDRELTADEAKRVEDLAGGVQATLPLNRQYALALRFGLVEVRGLVDQDGEPLQCSPAEFIRMASTSILAELAGEILRLSQLSEDDRKN